MGLTLHILEQGDAAVPVDRDDLASVTAALDACFRERAAILDRLGEVSHRMKALETRAQELMGIEPRPGWVFEARRLPPAETF